MRMHVLKSSAFCLVYLTNIDFTLLVWRFYMYFLYLTPYVLQTWFVTRNYSPRLVYECSYYWVATMK
jgi:hypothetical protein